MSDRTEQLTQQEIEQLKSERTSSMVLMTFVILVLCLVAIGVFIFFYLNYPNLSGFAVGGFLALIPLFIAYIVYHSASTKIETLNEEIYKGVKNVSVHPIEKRFIDIKERVKNRGRLNQEVIMSYDFYLIVKGEKIAVSEDDYYKHTEGQLVEIHKAKLSGKFLSINALTQIADKEQR